MLNNLRENLEPCYTGKFRKESLILRLPQHLEFIALLKSCRLLILIKQHCLYSKLHTSKSCIQHKEIRAKITSQSSSSDELDDGLDDAITLIISASSSPPRAANLSSRHRVLKFFAANCRAVFLSSPKPNLSAKDR